MESWSPYSSSLVVVANVSAKSLCFGACLRGANGRGREGSLQVIVIETLCKDVVLAGAKGTLKSASQHISKQRDSVVCDGIYTIYLRVCNLLRLIFYSREGLQVIQTLCTVCLKVLQYLSSTSKYNRSMERI